MSWQKSYLSLGFIGVLLLLVTADNSVHILLNYQLVTSSTLNWLPQSHYDHSKEIVIGGFEIVRETDEDSYNNQAEKQQVKRKPLFVCRALHMGVWVSGIQKYKEKRCTVTIHGNVHSYEKYDLLENVEGAAYVSWVRWEKYIEPPVVAVASDKMYVGRREVPKNEDVNTPIRYSHYIGTVTSNDNFGTLTYVKENGEEGSAKSGEVLVATEPKYYELSGVKLNWPKRRISNRVSSVLGEDTISNSGAEPATMAKGFGYSYDYLMYWGQGHAMLKALPTSITLSNGTFLSNISWGMEVKNNRQDVYTVEILLQPGTAVNVTLKANYTDMEVPYTGKLISHYDDDTSKGREISGFRREKAMFDITPEFGPIYFLNNHSLVPTTTPSPITEPITTKFSHSTSKEMHPHKMDTPHHDENLIIPPKKSDMSNIQSDDGGPLSLKNKVEVTYSGTCLFKPNLMIIPLLMIVQRIT